MRIILPCVRFDTFVRNILKTFVARTPLCVPGMLDSYLTKQFTYLDIPARIVHLKKFNYVFNYRTLLPKPTSFTLVWSSN